MYNDYEVAYESNINEYLTLMIVVGIGLAILTIITLIALSRVFKKANRSSITAFIPFYNIYILLEVANMDKKYFVPLLIPIVNIYYFLKVNIVIAGLFKKPKTFGIGMTVLPFIYYSILAYSSSEYVGINLSGMNSQIENIPVIDDNKNIEKEIQVNEEVEPSVSISTGLGKLGSTAKKDVDFDKLLEKKEVKEKPIPQPTQPVSKNSNTNNLKTADDIYSVDYIETSAQETKEVTNNQTSEKEEPLSGKVPDQISKVDLLASKTTVLEENGYKLCPNCKTRVVDGAEICLICGQKLV